ncbi:glycosyltransferase [Bremerella cremea]|uniref:glycosyltransferase n=1 Tax=Bremerella cremea TaxID=1031537 RepID=UPI0031EC2CC9
MNQQSPPRVAHFVNAAFALTETFVYDFVSAAQRYESWVYAAERVNRDLFPCDRVELRPKERGSFRQFITQPFRRSKHGTRLDERTFVRKVKPNVVHAHFGPRGWEALPLCRKHSIPLVTSFYGRDASAIPSEGNWRKRYDELFFEGDAFVVEGPAMKQRLVRLGAPCDRVHIVPLICRDGYEFRERSCPPEEMIRFAFVGRFVEKKGLPVLLQALQRAKEKLGAFSLAVIGDGDDRKQMEELAAQLGIAAEVEFRGFCSRSEMISQLSNADVLVAPSRIASDGDTEGGAPTILVEAMAMGLPIVGTTHADIPFVCSAYQDYLAEENDVAGLASQLVKIREDHMRWPALASDAIQVVRQQHSADNIDRLEAIYDLVVAGRTSDNVESSIKAGR